MEKYWNTLPFEDDSKAVFKSEVMMDSKFQV